MFAFFSNNERLLPVPYKWIVLNIFTTDVQFDSFGGMTQVCRPVEGHGIMLIRLQVVLHVGTPME